MRPNLAQDAPPAELSVGGVSYPIDVDFRAWIDVMQLLRDLIPAPVTLEHVQHNANAIDELEHRVFGRRIPHPAADVLAAVTEFAGGYPEAPVGPGREAPMQCYSFEWDLNHIVIALMNQFGIDLTWRRKEPFHWWEFLAYFRALSGNHYILRLMEIRGYRGKDEELRRQAQRFAVPREETAGDQALLDQFDELFYNS